ncbi:hypothetical protein [Bradyrhizobium canariense]|uniref:Uncharacterized protein n=1 Tax=Bradyrhizobium canariense TaxID=255045 RepID=A0A1H2BGC8_9BRAD|nr:hypothetical protein [Bradyrhizobium canariense]SDT57082.1 hypothetical protein SAMN05444158_7132 [Bradyrhizobium canariense]
MIGAALSRWTMAYFAAALLSLLAAEIMMTVGFGFPAESVSAPDTLVLVHLVTIGWLSLVMCGALFQFVPVLTATPLHSDRLQLPALALLVAGLTALVLGFLRLDGRARFEFPFLSVAAALLGAGFALVIWNIALTLRDARPLALPAGFIGIGLAAAGAAAALGIIFALTLDGTTSSAAFVNILGRALPLHIVAGLGGWLTVTAMGVTYRLLAMFMLAPDVDGASPRATLWLAALALTLLVTGGMATVLAQRSLAPVLVSTLLVAIAALALYGRDVLRLYRSRKRRPLELNGVTAGVALVNLMLAAILCVVLTLVGRFSDYIGALVFLFGFGWLSGLMLSQMYKIVAFLTWLEVYGPVLGKTPTPRVQDLVAERPAARWFLLFFFGVWIATVALLADAGQIFRIAALAMTAVTCGIVVQMVKTRRLANVPEPRRLPGNAVPPRLLFSSTKPT